LRFDFHVGSAVHQVALGSPMDGWRRICPNREINALLNALPGLDEIRLL
jgi:hypothetical protein